MRLALASFCAAILFAPIGSIGCASTSGLEEEMSRMRREMAAMHKELADTQLAMQRLEGQVTLLSVGRTTVEKAPETEVARSPSTMSNASASANSNAKSRSKD